MFYICIFLSIVGGLAELPASTCDANTGNKTGQITMTGPQSSSDAVTCTFTKKFKESAYFELQRFYTGNEKRYKHSRDSFLGFTVKTSMNTFDIQVHNDRIEKTISKQRCFGVFRRPMKWTLRLQLYTFADIRKTVVSIASKQKGGRFKDCFSFEIENVVDFFEVAVHGTTQTGMTQMIHNLDEYGETESFAWNKLANDVEEMRKDIDTISHRLSRTRVEHLSHKKSFEDNHVDLKESLTRFRIGQRDQLNRHSWFTYIVCFLIVVLGAITVKRLKDYMRKRDKIF